MQRRTACVLVFEFDHESQSFKVVQSDHPIIGCGASRLKKRLAEFARKPLLKIPLVCGGGEGHAAAGNRIYKSLTASARVVVLPECVLENNGKIRGREGAGGIQRL